MCFIIFLIDDTSSVVDIILKTISEEHVTFGHTDFTTEKSLENFKKASR